MQSQDLITRIPSVMEDPGARSVAKVYSQAYLDTAGPDGVTSALEELGSFVDDVMAQNAEFDRMLRTQELSVEAKLQLLEKVVVPRSTPLFANFIRVVAHHDRLELLPLIRQLAVREVERRLGQRRVQVTSAVELSSETLESIRNSMATALSVQPILETQIDPSLLGGMKIRVGDTVYDGSLKTQVKQLRARLRERCLNEIQRGRDRFSHQDGN
ncbi:ATP synthase F1 subunit delta [Schlesneria paludicola]|uniref:ATP synthase F1 subunit delta n=1 Tax=Schlesneria paludicola TaxID=360056 RepID=UPI00029A85F2|nr:ATP synthase F1 subunit delta [Schlesneria paludicola]